MLQSYEEIKIEDGDFDAWIDSLKQAIIFYRCQ